MTLPRPPVVRAEDVAAARVPAPGVRQAVQHVRLARVDVEERVLPVDGTRRTLDLVPEAMRTERESAEPKMRLVCVFAQVNL